MSTSVRNLRSTAGFVVYGTIGVCVGFFCVWKIVSLTPFFLYQTRQASVESDCGKILQGSSIDDFLQNSSGRIPPSDEGYSRDRYAFSRNGTGCEVQLDPVSGKVDAVRITRYKQDVTE
jgi:hypothetical protein